MFKAAFAITFGIIAAIIIAKITVLAAFVSFLFLVAEPAKPPPKPPAKVYLR